MFKLLLRKAPSDIITTWYVNLPTLSSSLTIFSINYQQKWQPEFTPTCRVVSAGRYSLNTYFTFFKSLLSTLHLLLRMLLVDDAKALWSPLKRNRVAT